MFGFAVAPGVAVLSALAAAAAPLGPEDTARHLGETATACGVVASAKFLSDRRSQPTLLNLGKPYPDQLFTAVIWGEDRAKFGTPEKSLTGKRVWVTGEIRDFRGIPEIRLSDPRQLSE
jgi:hypothetical protein